ncbi:MAG: glycosyltransferase [Rhodospirillaceae bacterium]|nr:glycosyltransferase [Rhodospirillaceae bacterium]
MTRGVVFVMSKQPAVGAVKTRLAREIGAVAAWQFYVNTLRLVLRRNGRAPFFQTRLLLTPIRARWGWPRGLCRHDQGRGDLGARMLAGLTTAPRGTPVVVVGCDIPGITVDHLREAFRGLARADVVFGPATDGGYWLVGFSGRRPLWRPFAGVRWSTRHALADTTANLRGRKIAYAAPLRDVDDFSSWLLARGVP